MERGAERGRQSGGRRSARCMLWAMAAFAATLLWACAAGDLMPEKPAPMDPGVQFGVEYTVAEFHDDVVKYHDASTTRPSPDRLSPKGEIRNRIVHRLIGAIDANYGEYEAAFHAGRAQFATAADWVGLGLTAAATIAGGEQTKTVLAAIATAVQGGRLSIDKNYFREKTSESLLSTMRAEREKVRKDLELKTQLDANQYSWEEAWSGLIKFFYAGTIPSALISLSDKTGAEATKAKDEAESAQAKTRIARLLTSEAILLKAEATDLFLELNGKTRNQGAAALRALGVKDVADGATAVDLIAMWSRFIEDETDPGRLKEIAKTLRSVKENP